MAERDIIMLKQKEMKQLHVIHKVLEGSLTQRQAAEIASLSERQIRRIEKRIEAEGDKGGDSTDHGARDPAGGFLRSS